MFSLEDRVALVTGGNGGIGKALALAFRDAGAQVVITGRDPEKNDRAAAELGARGLVMTLDVCDESAITRTVEQIRSSLGRLDILVNNAGAFRGGSSLEMPREDWDYVLDVNLTGAYLCSKYAGAIMRDQGRGKIINIGSMYSHFGSPIGPNYATAKTGLIGLTRSMGVDLSRHNIQVNAILPGFIETDMTAWVRQEPRGDEIRRRTPAGRWGQVSDLTGAAVYFASSASDFVTGTTLTIDGGYAINDRFLYD